jgi:hypothetical protein
MPVYIHCRGQPAEATRQQHVNDGVLAASTA